MEVLKWNAFVLSWMGFELDDGGTENGSCYKNIKRIITRILYYIHILVIFMGGIIFTPYIVIRQKKLDFKIMGFMTVSYFLLVLALVFWINKRLRNVNK